MGDDTAVEDKSGLAFQLAVAFLVLPTVAILLRLWSRAVAQNRYGWDDWTCLLGWAINTAVNLDLLVWSFHGLGKHLTAVAPSTIPYNLQLLYAGSILFNLQVGVIKASALFFYARIFKSDGIRVRSRTTRGFDIALYAGFFMTAALEIFCVVTVIFSCTPPRKFWDPTAEGTCISTFAFYMVEGVLDVVLDFYVLLLPMPMLWRLQIKSGRKWLIAGAFACAYCVLAVSVARLIVIIFVGNNLTVDFTWNAFTVLMLAMAQPAIGVISLCLPSCFHLWRRAKQGGFSALFHRRRIDGASSYARSGSHPQHGGAGGSKSNYRRRSRPAPALYSTTTTSAAGGVATISEGRFESLDSMDHKRSDVIGLTELSNSQAGSPTRTLSRDGLGSGGGGNTGMDGPLQIRVETRLQVSYQRESLDGGVEEERVRESAIVGAAR